MDSNINVLIWNCYGVRNKTAELNKRFQEHNIDIGIITETKLLEGDNLKFSGYDIIKKDRKGGKGREGGVLIVIQKNLVWEPIMEKDMGGKLNEVETVDIRLKGEIENRYITGIYRRPGKKTNKMVWEKIV